MAKYKMGLYDVFTFGKCKSCTIDHIIRNDISYITWLIEEDILELTDEAYKVYQNAL